MKSVDSKQSLPVPTWNFMDKYFGLNFGKRFFDIENILDILLVFTSNGPYIIVRLRPGINLTNAHLSLVGVARIKKVEL